MAAFWILILSLAISPASAVISFFPPALTDVENKTTSFDPDIWVSSKETSSLCETTPNVKSYSGYVGIPSAALESTNGLPGFPVNTFYWFFESRKDPQNAPFVLWLGGGPGFSGVASALFEHGPCTVNPDSNSTTLNQFSWNNEVNMLYIDSPTMTGFSYDTIVNATIDGLNSSLPIVPSQSSDLPPGNNTFQVGTFGSQDPTNLSNSTGNVVPVIWTAVQAWFSNFPQYKPANARMSIWTESFGGRFGPFTAEFFLQKNEGVANGTIKNAMPLHIDTLGIINGYIDPALHAASYPAFVNNNTYGLQTVPPEVQQSMQTNLTKPGGCLDAIKACQTMADALDPSDTATNKTLGQICSNAFLLCELTVQKAYDATSNRSQDDIGHPSLDPFPPQFYTGFFSQAWVQQALGVPVNFTANSATALEAFMSTGDLTRNGALQAIGRLLDNGVQVTTISGDRDYQVNWFGGEQVSLNVDFTDADAFRTAGYANLTTQNGTCGGVTRQAGNFSFTRVFEAGHSVPAYQPAVALDIFSRAMAHQDIATGKILLSTLDNSTVYVTQGPSSSFAIKNDPPVMPQPVCYTWAIGLTCEPKQQQWLIEGTAVVKDFIVIGNSANGIENTGNASTKPPSKR